MINGLPTSSKDATNKSLQQVQKTSDTQGQAPGNALPGGRADEGAKEGDKDLTSGPKRPSGMSLADQIIDKVNGQLAESFGVEKGGDLGDTISAFVDSMLQKHGRGGEEDQKGEEKGAPAPKKGAPPPGAPQGGPAPDETKGPDKTEGPAPSDGSDAERLLELVNAERAKQGLNPLKLSDVASQAAQAHSDDQAKMGKMSHTGSDGSSFDDRLRKAGAQFSTGAENVAAGQKTPEQVFDAWMKSPGHRANILKEGISEMGIGRSGDYWTQVFTG